MEKDIRELITEYKEKEKKQRYIKLVIIVAATAGASILAGVAASVKNGR